MDRVQPAGTNYRSLLNVCFRIGLFAVTYFLLVRPIQTSLNEETVVPVLINMAKDNDDIIILANQDDILIESHTDRFIDIKINPPFNGYFFLAVVLLWPLGWSQPMKLVHTEDMDEALSLARAQGKVVLVDFTGSDWCSPCIMLHHQVLETEVFKEFAADKMVLLTLDYPRIKPQDPKVKEANEKLMEKFKIESFPTVILLDADGKEFFRPDIEDAIVETDDGFEFSPEKFNEVLKKAIALPNAKSPTNPPRENP